MLQEVEVTQEACRGNHCFGEGQKVFRSKQDSRDESTSEDEEEDCGEDAAHPSLIESLEGKLSQEHVLGNDGSNQIPRDHEEDIDADKAAREPGDFGVKEEHR